MAENIVRESKKETEGYAQESIDEAKNMISKAGSSLSKAEVREQIYTNEYYPRIDDIAVNSWIPNSFQKLFMSFSPIRSKSRNRSSGDHKNIHKNCSETYLFWVRC